MNWYELWGEHLIANIAFFANINSRLALFLMGKEVSFKNYLVAFFTLSIHLGCLRTDLLCWVKFITASSVYLKRFGVEISLTERALESVLLSSMSWFRPLFLLLNFRSNLLLFLLWFFSSKYSFLTSFNMVF